MKAKSTTFNPPLLFDANGEPIEWSFPLYQQDYNPGQMNRMLDRMIESMRKQAKESKDK